MAAKVVWNSQFSRCIFHHTEVLPYVLGRLDVDLSWSSIFVAQFARVPLQLIVVEPLQEGGADVEALGVDDVLRIFLPNDSFAHAHADYHALAEPGSRG